jgi:hypothetical protein
VQPALAEAGQTHSRLEKPWCAHTFRYFDRTRARFPSKGNNLDRTRVGTQIGGVQLVHSKGVSSDVGLRPVHSRR